MTGDDNRKAALALIRGIIGDATVMAESARALERQPDEAPPSAPSTVGKSGKPAKPVAPLPKTPPPEYQVAAAPEEARKGLATDIPADDKLKANSQSDVMALLKRHPKK